MNVSLTPELEKLVLDKVASGMYSSASEVIRESLRLLKERDALENIRLEELRKHIQVGISQADNGQYSEMTIPDIKAQGRQRLSEMNPDSDP
ncbi:MAG: type II toxin-antitoxin system ParD family antitoxin [Leptolyngbyaceae bacterium]|nr:type II toxin-antitoxin system ParD family antitoxin [Leptolyngbyaceae bacterium]